MLTTKFEMTLKCHLTEDEVRARAQGLAIVQKEIEENEARKKDVDDRLKTEKKGLEHQRGVLAREVREETTFRPVDCIERIDAESEMVQTVRIDTGEIVQTRPAKDSDRQGVLVPRDDDPDEKEQV